MKASFIKFIAVIFTASITAIHAEEKVALEQPKEKDLAAELQDQPDGVLRVKTNENGGFKSLVVKASVEIEDSLGAAKGKQIARKEAETKCKQALAKWLQENCVFAETSKKTTTINTKGESTKDAAGNVVKLRSQQGSESKEFTEVSASAAQAVLRGLIVLQSEVTAGKDSEYVLIMGLSQENMDQAGAVGRALSDKGGTTGTAGDKQRATPGDNDGPAPEIKRNPAAKGF
jgi:hypothetical protein